MIKAPPKKTPVGIAGLSAEVNIPGPVTTWAQMSPEKRAELKALYENRPVQKKGLQPTPPKRRNVTRRNRFRKGAKEQVSLVLVSR